MQLILRNSCNRDNKLEDRAFCPEFRYDYSDLHDNHEKLKQIITLNIFGVK